MRSFVLILGQDDPAGAMGAMAAAVLDRPGGGHLLRKGQRIGKAETAALAELAGEAPGTQVSLILPDAGDVGEDEAALLLGGALAGPGVGLREPSQGRTRLTAVHAGLLLVDSARLAAANAVPDISIYSLFGGTPVAAGTLLAEAKITPLVAPRAHVEQAVAVLSGQWSVVSDQLSAIRDPHSAIRNPQSAIEVWPFAARTAGLLIREKLAPEAGLRLVESLRARLDWFGSGLAEADVMHLGGGRAEAAAGLRWLLDRGADLLLTAGGSTSDPADPILCALDDLGAVMLRRGVPIHPGSLLWVASCAQALVIGVPSCGAFSEQTSLDLLLPRLLALGPAGLDGIETLAEGGLLTRGMEHRFPDYGSSAP
ncbi:MAG: hypothetical protein ACR2M0_15270 [Chloroflexia bacterium]